MKKLLLIVMLITSIATTACKKDVIESKTDDISRTWKIIQATEDGDDMTAMLSAIRLTFKKDGNYEVSGYSSPEVGKWSFNTDATKLTLTSDGDSKIMDIVELSSKKLKLKGTDDDGSVTEMTLAPAK